MKIEGDIITFSSGHQQSFNCGIVGLSRHDDGSFGASEGYDSGVWNELEDEEYCVLSPEDVAELADYMAQQWRELAERMRERTPRPGVPA